jgi:GT2 family glycosyltransferase
MSHKQVRFSIIIPTYSRHKELLFCLQSLTRLDYPRDKYEVVVVDDGSETPPDDIVAAFRERLNVTLLTQSNAGPATARNVGALTARAEFLAFTDDDCAPASNWLRSFAARFEQTPKCAIGGQTLNILQNNPYSSASQLLIDYLYSYYNVDAEQAQFLTSNNFALPADRFHAIGGFDTTFPRAAGEDREFCARWKHHGYRLIYAPEVKVFHAHRLKLNTFWRQHFNYGRAAFYFHRKCAQSRLERVKLEPPRFYLNLLRYPFLRARESRSVLLALLLILSQFSNAMGFMWEKVVRS